LIIDYQIHAALTASGNPRLVMALACIVCGINCCLALLTVPFGLFAAACGFAIRSYLTIFFSLFFFRKIFDIGIISIMKVVYPAFISSTVMFGVIAIFKLSMADRIAPALSLALTCLMG